MTKIFTFQKTILNKISLLDYLQQIIYLIDFLKFNRTLSITKR